MILTAVYLWILLVGVWCQDDTDLREHVQTLEGKFSKLETRISKLEVFLARYADRDGQPVTDFVPKFVENTVAHALNSAFPDRSQENQGQKKHLDTGLKKNQDLESLNAQLEQCQTQVNSKMEDLAHQNEKCLSSMNMIQESLESMRRNMSELHTGMTESQMRLNEVEKRNGKLESRLNVSQSHLQERDERVLNITESLRKCKCDVPGTSFLSSSSSSTGVLTTSKPAISEVKMTRLIVSARHHYYPVITHQFWLRGYALSRYTLSVDLLEAMVYEPNSRKLLVARSDPEKIEAYPLDGGRPTTLRRNIRAHAMAVDSSMNRVFLATSIPGNLVSCMNNDGTGYVEIAENGVKIPSGLALDTSRKLVYVARIDQIYVMTYTGTGERILVQGRRDMFYAVALDPTGQTLFYNDRKAIYKMALPNSESRYVTLLSYEVWDLVQYSGNLYACSNSGRRGKVDVINIKTGDRRSLPDVYRSISRVTICLAP